LRSCSWRKCFQCPKPKIHCLRGRSLRTKVKAYKYFLPIDLFSSLQHSTSTQPSFHLLLLANYSPGISSELSDPVPSLTLTFSLPSGNNTDCFFCGNCIASPYHNQHIQGEDRSWSAPGSRGVTSDANRLLRSTARTN